MSARNVLNINEEIVVLTLAAGVAGSVTLPYIPEFVEFTNTGTGVAYAKAIAVGGAAMTVPGATFPARPSTQSGVEIQPGASKTYRYVLRTDLPTISAISAAGTTLSVKIGRGV